MNTDYYKIEAYIDGEREILFGSFDKADCKYELEAEKEGWKAEGYKKIKIITTTTEDKPDPAVYENLVSADEIEAFVSFENEGELSEYIDDGLITKSGDQYFVHDEYIIKTIKENKTNPKRFWMDYAPCMNFQYDQEELIEKGIEHGFIKEINNGYLLINHKYQGKPEQ